MSDPYSALMRDYEETWEMLHAKEDQVDDLYEIIHECSDVIEKLKEENKKLREENLELRERIDQMEWAMGI